MIFHDSQLAVLHFANHYRVESPLLENVQHFGFAAALRHQQHALLRFAQHDFVRRHAGFALRHFCQINFDSCAAARSHFHRRARQPRGAHVLNRHHRARVHRFDARFQEQFFHERIADLHIRPFLLRFFREFRRRQQRSAVNSVASRFCADINHRIPDAFRLRQKNVFLACDSQRQRIHQWILRVARFKTDFSANRRHAKTISVIRHPANHAIQNPPIRLNLFG